MRICLQNSWPTSVLTLYRKNPGGLPLPGSGKRHSGTPKKSTEHMSIEETIENVLALTENTGKDIHSILEKDWFQRLKGEPISGEAWAESEEERQDYRKHFDWECDGKFTGVPDDKTFYAIQEKVYGRVIYPLDF